MSNDRAGPIGEFPPVIETVMPVQTTLRVTWLRQAVLICVCLLPIVSFLTVFFVGPIALNVVQSLHPLASSRATFGGFAKLIEDWYFYKVLAQTGALGVVVTFLCLLLGYPFAYGLTKTRGRTRAMLMMVLLAPLLVNVVVRSYGWMVLVGGGGVVDAVAKGLHLGGVQLMYTWTGITIALVHVLLPFMVISIASQMESLDSAYEEAAATLGASPARAFRLVILPLTIEGVITGAIITFTMTIGSFVTVMLLGDNSTMVLPLLIYQQLTVTNDWPAAAALGIALLTFVIALLCLQVLLQRWFRARVSARGRK
ncbi:MULTISPECIES: ABC transporter permease [unclassified Burkholderia]|uniref:ABC transporter permease n=1 Tax=unclassified Burkholderia TaxID=2613784 RepID=UPI000F579D3F|nr:MULTISPECIES: ABC transporter permease [unclassified Burkholderia]RQS26880.1 ABC transporter permease [Burkholderia sp. Bp8995]RQS51766.1 ABC transporter permease [Burkholderia sp. Bp8989]